MAWQVWGRGHDGRGARLDADLVTGLKRVRLAHFRAQAADILQTATTQRWAPDPLLRTLLETELAGRDAANQAARRRGAGFPAEKRFEDFQVSASSVPPATVDSLPSLEWLRARENLCLIGPAGTGKSHLLLAAGHAAVLAGYRVKYLLAADLVETLYRGLADNTVGKVIESLLRHDVILLDELGFAPLDDTGTQLFFRFVAAAYERRSLGMASHWPFEQWGHFLPQPSTAASLLDRLLHHAVIVVTEGESFRMKEARSRSQRPVARPLRREDAMAAAPSRNVGVTIPCPSVRSPSPRWAASASPRPRAATWPGGGAMPVPLRRSSPTPHHPGSDGLPMPVLRHTLPGPAAVSGVRPLLPSGGTGRPLPALRRAGGAG